MYLLENINSFASAYASSHHTDSLQAVNVFTSDTAILDSLLCLKTLEQEGLQVSDLEVPSQPFLQVISPYPAINSSTVNREREYPLNWKIPGLGEQTKEKCGCITGAHVCPSGLGAHPVKYQAYHCKNFNCPVCFPWAAAQAARRSSDRLFGGVQAYKKISKPRAPVNHIEISVPPEQYDNFEWKEGKAQAIEYAQKIGVSGGYIIPHPGRVHEHLKRPILKALKTTGYDKSGYWDGVRRDVLGLGSVQAYLKMGPHFHILGYFRIPKKADGSRYTSEDFEKETGWTYKNITVARAKKTCSRIKPETKDSSRGITSYLLTHHLLQRNKDAVTYFGDISYNKLGKRESKEKVYNKCPECGEQLYKVLGSGTMDLRVYVASILQGEIKLERGVNAVISKYTATINEFYVNLHQTKIYIEDPPDEGGG